MAARILRWVVMAFRPLTLSELSIAVEDAIGTSDDFSQDEIMKDCVEYCGYFLTIKDEEVNLIHQSAKDYLLRNAPDSDPELEVFRVNEYAANLEIARCFYYLQNGFLEAGLPGDNTLDLKVFPLLSYAGSYWHEHSRTLDCSEDIFDLSLPFYNEMSEIRELWLKKFRDLNGMGYLLRFWTPLHLASFFGILPLAQNLLNKAKHLLELSKKDAYGRTALILAAWNGHEAVVQQLLEKGANIKAKNNWGQTALMLAALNRHDAVVQQLLEKGADVEAENDDGEMALIQAAWNGHDAVVRLLLEKGANIEAKDNDGNTALDRAALYGNEGVVRLLTRPNLDS